MSFVWNQSRTTALAFTLLLHGMAAVGLLSVRMNVAPLEPVSADMIWLPAPEQPSPEPAPSREPVPAAPTALPHPTPDPLPLPEREPASNAITLPDWEGEARAVAHEFGRAPERRQFGPEPEEKPRQLRSQRPPPSVFERPLPRVGTVVRLPDGEQIKWVSDNCYVSLDSQSLTMREHHALKRGITSCQVGVGKPKARGDLFDPIKRKKVSDTNTAAPKRCQTPSCEQQEPGCGPGTDRPSCAP